MFAFVLLAGSVVKDMASLLAEGQLTVRAFFRLLVTLLPYVFVHALPLGLLTGILLTMGRLSGQGELLAMRAAGFSLTRLSSSLLLFAAAGVLVSLVVNFVYGPMAKTEYRRELGETVRKNPLGFVVEKTFVRDFPGALLYVGEKEEGRMADIWFWDLDDQGRATRFHRAASAYFDYEEEENSLNLVLLDGIFDYVAGDDPEDYSNLRSSSFSRASFRLSLDRIIGRATFSKKLTWMTYRELVAERAKWREAIRDARNRTERETARANLLKAQMAFHKTFASGFAILSFALLGAPLGARLQRKETSANLFAALGLALGYYVMMLAIDLMDGMQAWRPDLLYWAPNFLYQGLGVWLLWRADNGPLRKSRRRIAE